MMNQSNRCWFAVPLSEGHARSETRDAAQMAAPYSAWVRIMANARNTRLLPRAEPQIGPAYTESSTLLRKTMDWVSPMMREYEINIRTNARPNANGRPSYQRVVDGFIDAT